MDSLALDVNLALEEQVGSSGLRVADFEALKPAVAEAHRDLQTERRSGKLPFFDLPTDSTAAQASSALGRELASFENLVVLGIGGSALGPKALFTALCHPFHNLLPASRRGGPRMFFPDNPDPATFSSLLEVLDLPRTSIAAITKSGGTAETWAQLLILRDRLNAAVGEANASKHIVAVTDPEKGALRAVAKEQGWRTLPVPPLVGGRFSVFTAVGLLPSAAAGIDVNALLEGAAAMVRRCEEPDLFKNPAYLFASTLHLMDTKRGRKTHVFMPYVDALRESADWFVQLWAESLGKRPDVGPTPLPAVGSVDQHSMLQLLMEGPLDKLTIFVGVDRPRADVTIPKAFAAQPDVSYLGGHSLHDLLSAEQRATAAALAANGRPSITLRLPTVNARAVGELFMMLEIATAFAGSLYKVNPFDQPGVEAGKRYTCGLLGRPGYEAAKKELDARPASQSRWVV